MILSSFAFHTALLVTTLATTSHTTAAKNIKTLSKSSSPSMVPNEGLVKTQQSKNFHDLLQGSNNNNNNEPTMTNMMQQEATYSFLSLTIQLFSTLCDRVIAATKGTWKRIRNTANDLLFTAGSHQDNYTEKLTLMTNSTWTTILNDLTLDNTKINVKTIVTFWFGRFVDPRYIHYGNIPSIDPCELTGYHLGLPYGLFSQRFFRSAHVPVCLPTNVDTCTTIYKSPMQYMMDYVAEHYNYQQNENHSTTITRDEMNKALNNWLCDELETFQHWLHDQRAVVEHCWNKKSDSTIEWIVSVTKNNKNYSWKCILEALQIVEKWIVANLQPWAMIFMRGVRRVWDQIVVVFDPIKSQCVYLKDIKVQLEMMSVVTVVFVREAAMEIDVWISGEYDGFKKWLEDQSAMLKDWWGTTGMGDFTNPIVTITFHWVPFFAVVLIGLAICKNHGAFRRQNDGLVHTSTDMAEPLLSNKKLRKKLRKKLKRARKAADAAAITTTGTGLTTHDAGAATAPATATLSDISP